MHYEYNETQNQICMHRAELYIEYNRLYGIENPRRKTVKLTMKLVDDFVQNYMSHLFCD